MSYQSFITIIISIGTTLSCAFSARVINKFGTGLVTALSTLISALSLLGFALSNSIIFLCLFAIPLGIGAGSIDTALNNYVAVRYKPYQMNFLHCFYGVGVSVSPFIVSYAISLGNYKIGFFALFAIQTLLAIISIFILPLWKKVAEKEDTEKFSPVTISVFKMAKLSSVWFAWIAFFTTCALEFTCGAWGATYLSNTVGLSTEKSAFLVSLYYIGITVSRAISGVLSTKIKTQTIIFLGYGVSFLGIFMLFLPVPPVVKSVGLLLIGLGNGQTFPNLTLLTPKNFGKEYSQSVIGSLMLVANIGITVTPPLFGVLAQKFSTNIFAPFNLILLALLVLSTIIYLKKVKTQKF